MVSWTACQAENWGSQAAVTSGRLLLLRVLSMYAHHLQADPVAASHGLLLRLGAVANHCHCCCACLWLPLLQRHLRHLQPPWLRPTWPQLPLPAGQPPSRPRQHLPPIRPQLCLSHARTPRTAGAARLLPKQRQHQQRCPPPILPLPPRCRRLLSGCWQCCPRVFHLIQVRCLRHWLQHHPACWAGGAASLPLHAAAARKVPAAAPLCYLPAWRAAMQSCPVHSCSRNRPQRLQPPAAGVVAAAAAESDPRVHPEPHIHCCWTPAGLHQPRAPAGTVAGHDKFLALHAII